MHSDKSAANVCKLRRFIKFQFQLLLSNFAFGSRALSTANLFVLKRTKPHHLWCSLAKWECQQKLDMLTSKLISFAWSSLGTSLGAWNVSSYLLRPCLLSTLPLLTSGRPRAMLYELLSDSVPSDFDLASQNLFLVLEDCHESEVFFCAPVWEKFPETTMFPMVAGVPGPTLNLECGNRCCNDSKRQKIASPAFPDLKVKGMMEVSLTINQ